MIRKTLPLILAAAMCVGSVHSMAAFANSAPSKASSDTPPTAYVFFGDSLTDTGNFPMPVNYNADKKSKNLNADKKSKNLLDAYNIFVPITNLTSDNAVRNVKDGSAFRSFLKKSINSELNTVDDQGPEHTIDGNNVSGWSINWPLYFVHDEESKDTGSLRPLYSSSDYNDLPLSANLLPNINYAWAGAVIDNNSDLLPYPTDPRPAVVHSTNPACYTDDDPTGSGAQAISKECTDGSSGSIAKSVTSYRSNSAAHDYKYTNHVLIPDIASQMKFFKNYINNFYSSRTAASFFKNKQRLDIIIYAGGNDVSNYVKKGLEWSLRHPNEKAEIEPDKFHRVAGQLVMDIQDLNKAIEDNATASKHLDVHFYVLKLPDLTKLHETQSYIKGLHLKSIQKFMDTAQDALNTELSALQSKKNQKKVFLDSSNPVAYTYLTSPAQTINGLKEGSDSAACVQQANPNNWFDNGSSSSLVDACTTNGKGVFSWNNAHFTTQVNKDFAESLKSSI